MMFFRRVLSISTILGNWFIELCLQQEVRNCNVKANLQEISNLMKQRVLHLRHLASLQTSP